MTVEDRRYVQGGFSANPDYPAAVCHVQYVQSKPHPCAYTRAIACASRVPPILHWTYWTYTQVIKQGWTNLGGIAV